MTSSAVALGALLSLLASLLPGMAPRAHACSIGSFGTPERQREALIESLDGSELVFVGTVFDERRVGRIEENEIYVSRVVPEAILAGEVEGEAIDVRTVAYDDTFCEGGSRLREGEKVLLALDWAPTGTVLEGEEPFAWVLHHFLGKVRIDETVAVSQYANTGLPIGPPEDIVQEVGTAVGAPPGQVEAAVAAVAASTAPPLPVSSDTDYTWRIAAIAGIVLAVVAIAVAILRSRRSTLTRSDQ